MTAVSASKEQSFTDRLRALVLDAGGGDPVSGIGLAARAGAELAVVAEQLSAAACVAARRSGMSWDEVMQTVRDAKAVPPSPADDDVPEAAMFAPKLWRALAAAAALAGQQGHSAVRGTDLWSGMLAVAEGSAATVVTILLGPEPVEAVRERLVRSGARPSEQVTDGLPIFAGDGHAGLPALTEEASAQLRAAVEVAREMGHDFVGTEHVLLAMLDESGPAWEGKEATRVTHAGVRAELLAMLGSIGLATAASAEAAAGSAGAR